MQNPYDLLIQKLTSWAQAQDAIRAVVIIGSRARTENPADEWSDLDVIIATREPKWLLTETDWLQELGNPKIIFQEGTIDGARETRVLFEGGIVVDLIILSVEDFCERTQLAEAQAIMKRGARVILDKDEITQYPALGEECKPRLAAPAQGEFLNLTKDFFFHVVWTAQKLRRGETMQAKMCCDNYMKNLLFRMIRWQAFCEHGSSYDTWHEARFFEQWVNPDVLKQLSGAYAHYDEEGVWKALFATADVFGKISKETAAHLGFPYPEEEQRYAMEYSGVLYRERSEGVRASLAHSS